MSARTPPNLVRLSVALYRRLLAIYPLSYRQAFGPLMLQLFRDLCQEAFEQGNILYLIKLWVQTLSDLVLSAPTIYLDTLKEAIVAANLTIKPMPWPKILLVVIPGVLISISRIYSSLGWLAMISIILITLLVFATLATQKRLPTWGLLALGLVTNWALLWIGNGLMSEYWVSLWIDIRAMMRELGVGTSIDYRTGELGIAILLWTAILLLAWRYKPSRRVPSWALILSGLIIVSFTAILGYSVLSITGLMLLPVALGLPLAQRHGSQASLFVIGAYSLWLFDSDYYSGPFLQDTSFYPIYSVLLCLLFISVAPLLMLRARSQLGRAIGLLTLITIVLIARVAVPLLINPVSHPLRIWLGDALGSVFALVIIALTLVLYQQTDGSETPMNMIESGETVLTG